QRIARLVQIGALVIARTQVESREPPHFAPRLLGGKLFESVLRLLIVLLIERGHRRVELIAGDIVATAFVRICRDRDYRGSRDDPGGYQDLIEVGYDELAHRLDERLEFVGLLKLFARDAFLMMGA